MSGGGKRKMMGQGVEFIYRLIRAGVTEVGLFWGFQGDKSEHNPHLYCVSADVGVCAGPPEGSGAFVWLEQLCFGDP